MTDHFVDVHKKVLSPVAQKVLDAAFTPYDCEALYSLTEEQHTGIIAAAAIRALADQVVPTKPKPVTCPGDNKEEFIARYNVWINMHLTRNKILAIATELEGQQ